MGGIAAAALPIVGSAIGGLFGGNQQSRAAEGAAATQIAASQGAISEQRRQFDRMMENLQPFITAGTGAIEGLSPYAQAGAPALEQQQALLGLLGPQAQQQAIASIESSPIYSALARQGEEAILQNAAATGGLRGGRTQAALAQFRPQMLNDLINQQYQRLGGMANMGLGTTQNIAQLGQSSAAGAGAAGLQTATNIGNQMQNIGAAHAGNILGQANIESQMMGNLFGQAGQLFGGGGFQVPVSTPGFNPMSLFGGF